MAAGANKNGAFLPEHIVVEGAASGPLKGRTFAAKDLYDVAGHVTGFGNPTWAATHPPATANAPAVQALLDAGATLVGKVHMDELAYSLGGENMHYGTPVNPACPERVPGGSSSGSAVAVADGSADIALGSDTGGSVRVPASYCGILGLRPTQGRVSMERTCALAPSYDTGGFFARDMAVFQAAADALLIPSTRRPTAFKRLLLARDAFAVAKPDAAAALTQVLKAATPALSKHFGGPTEVDLGGSDAGTLAEWADTNCVSENAESWGVLGPWITAHKPAFGPGIAKRFAWASRLTPAQIEDAAKHRAAVTARMEALLGGDAALLLPATPFPAPRLGMPVEQLDECWMPIITLVAPAAMSGLPQARPTGAVEELIRNEGLGMTWMRQVSLPAAEADGCPLGLGVIGPRGSDEDLLRLGEQLMKLLPRPASGKSA